MWKDDAFCVLGIHGCEKTRLRALTLVTRGIGRMPRLCFCVSADRMSHSHDTVRNTSLGNWPNLARLPICFSSHYWERIGFENGAPCAPVYLPYDLYSMSFFQASAKVLRTNEWIFSFLAWSRPESGPITLENKSNWIEADLDRTDLWDSIPYTAA